MAQQVLIIGGSGSGKSTSMESLDPKETFIINIANKPLPFKGWKSKYTLWSKENQGGNMYASAKAQDIVDCMEYISNKRPEIKNIILDDFQYMSGFEYMEKALEKGYEKFNRIAANLSKVVTKGKDLRDDLFIFYTNHAEISEDTDGNRMVKAKTCGKMIDNALTLEGMFATVLFCKAKKTKEGIAYVFETQNNGENTCKSPKGMFATFEISNDLGFVKKAMVEYEK